MDGELGLDLEDPGKRGERLYERAAHGLVAGHDVVEAVAIDPLDRGAHEVVAEAVEGALVFLAVGAVGEAVAHGHSGLAGKDGPHHLAGLGLVVGVVAVDHEVAVGLDAGNIWRQTLPLSWRGSKRATSVVPSPELLSYT